MDERFRGIVEYTTSSSPHCSLNAMISAPGCPHLAHRIRPSSARGRRAAGSGPQGTLTGCPSARQRQALLGCPSSQLQRSRARCRMQVRVRVQRRERRRASARGQRRWRADRGWSAACPRGWCAGRGRLRRRARGLLHRGLRIYPRGVMIESEGWCGGVCDRFSTWSG